MKGYTKENRIIDIAKSTGLPANVVRQVLDAEDEAVAQGLREGKRVYLDNIGTLHVQQVPERERYVPTKGRVTVPAHRRVKFRASATLLDRL